MVSRSLCPPLAFSRHLAEYSWAVLGNGNVSAAAAGCVRRHIQGPHGMIQAGSDTECEKGIRYLGSHYQLPPEIFDLCSSDLHITITCVSLCVRVVLQSALLTATSSSLCPPPSRSPLFPLHCLWLLVTPPANLREWRLTTPFSRSQWMGVGHAELWALMNENISKN